MREKKPRSRADRRADELLERLDAVPVNAGRTHVMTDNSDPTGMHSKLLEQIERADGNFICSSESLY
jgi:hypothetical protein